MGVLSAKHPVSDLPWAILALKTGILRRAKGNRELNESSPRRQMPALALNTRILRRPKCNRELNGSFRRRQPIVDVAERHRYDKWIAKIKRFEPR